MHHNSIVEWSKVFLINIAGITLVNLQGIEIVGKLIIIGLTIVYTLVKICNEINIFLNNRKNKK